MGSTVHSQYATTLCFVPVRQVRGVEPASLRDSIVAALCRGCPGRPGGPTFERPEEDFRIKTDEGFAVPASFAGPESATE